MSNSATTYCTVITRKDVRQMWRDGDTAFSILTAAIQSGLEYPDAFYMVTSELKMDHEGAAELKDGYDNFI